MSELAIVVINQCPNCGDRADVIEHPHGGYVVACFGCGVSGAILDTEDEAIGLWNCLRCFKG